MTIDASLYCGADTNKTAADTSKQVPISRKGNARIRDRSFLGAYIAVDGQRG